MKSLLNIIISEKEFTFPDDYVILLTVTSWEISVIRKEMDAMTGKRYQMKLICSKENRRRSRLSLESKG